MLTFLLLAAILLAVTGFGVLALPFFLLGAALWLVLLPVKLLFGFIALLFGLVFGGAFRLLFWALGALLGLIVIPVVLVLGGIAVIGALIAGLVALLAPLVPVVLLLLLGWAVYRVARPSAGTVS